MEDFRVEQLSSMKDDLLDSLAALLVNVVEGGASIGFLPPLSLDDARTYWNEVIQPDVILWVAVQGDHVVGTIQLHLAMKTSAAHRAEIAKLMVHSNNRKQGIAKLLMRTAENAAKLLGRTLLVLDTRSGDPIYEYLNH